MSVSAHRAFNLLKELAYEKVSCSEAETRAANRLLEEALACGVEAHIEEFSVPCGRVHKAKLTVTAPYVKVGGVVLAMKGTAAQEELDEAKNAIRQLGLKVEKVAQFPVDGTAHTVIALKKIAPTPAKYPRRFAKIKQNPL